MSNQRHRSFHGIAAVVGLVAAIHGIVDLINNAGVFGWAMLGSGVLSIVFAAVLWRSETQHP